MLRYSETCIFIKASDTINYLREGNNAGIYHVASVKILTRSIYREEERPDATVSGQFGDGTGSRSVQVLIN